MSMNKNDQLRKDSIIKTLCKAKEQAEVFLLYLNANNREIEDIYAAILTLEHIDISLEQLGALNREAV